MRAYSFDKCFLGTIYVMDSALGTGTGTKAALLLPTRSLPCNRRQHQAVITEVTIQTFSTF